MNKSRQGGWSFVIVFLTILLSMSTYTYYTNHKDMDKSFVRITIEEGDTLWDLSEKFQGGHGLTKNEFVNWVEQKNKLEAELLQPGKTVVIPIPVDTDLVQIASK